MIEYISTNFPIKDRRKGAFHYPAYPDAYPETKNMVFFSTDNDFEPLFTRTVLIKVKDDGTPESYEEVTNLIYYDGMTHRGSKLEFNLNGYLLHHKL